MTRPSLADLTKKRPFTILVIRQGLPNPYTLIGSRYLPATWATREAAEREARKLVLLCQEDRRTGRWLPENPATEYQVTEGPDQVVLSRFPVE